MVFGTVDVLTDFIEQAYGRPISSFVAAHGEQRTDDGRPVGRDHFVMFLSRLADHPEAEAFLNASPAEQDAIRQRSMEAAMKAKEAALAAPRPIPHERKGKGGWKWEIDPLVSRFIHELSRTGCSDREISKRTGIGRNRIARIVHNSPRKGHARKNARQARDAKGRFSGRRER